MNQAPAGGRRIGVLCSDGGSRPDDVAAAAMSKIYKPGNAIRWGVFQAPVDPASVPSEEVRSQLRAEASATLTNIDADERQRRWIVGAAFGAVTVALGIGLLSSDSSALARLAIGPPLFISYGFLGSAQKGL